jgi:uncharacterized Zn finger protein
MDLDLDRIRDLCTESSFERGARYFEEGRVEIVDASLSGAVAKVRGTDDYEVEIDLDDGINASCSCPYDWGGYCKHIVATLLALSQEKEKVHGLIARREGEEHELGRLLKGASLEDLRDFLLREFEKLPRLKSHFLICFSESGEGKNLTEYKKEIVKLYRSAGGSDNFIPYGEEIDFSSFEEVAKLWS